MNNTYIIADGKKLVPSGPIAITKQINDIADTRGRQTGYTNQFRLPLTQEVLEALGLTNTLNSANDAIYKKLDAQLIMDGVPVELWGKLQIKGVSKDVQAQIRGPEADFFETLESRSLHDLDLSGLDHNWDKSIIATSQSNTATEGWVYPVIDYGSFPFANRLDAKLLFPSVYWKYLLDAISLESGYTFEGDIFDDDLYPHVVFPFSEGDYKHSERYIEERSFQHFVSQKISIGSTFTTDATLSKIGTVTFGNVQFVQVATNTTFQSISVNVNIESINRNGNGALMTPYIAILKNGSTVLAQTQAFVGNNTVSIGSTALVPGDTLSIGILVTVTSASANPPSIINITIDSGSFFTPEIETNISYGDDITGESFTPDWTQKAFVVAFMNQFGLIPTVDPGKKVVTFTPFEQIRDNKSKAEDWSGKLVRQNGAKEWYINKTSKVGPYGKSNYLSYKRDKTLGFEELGQGEISCNDENLPAFKTLFTLPYAASESFQQLAQPTAVVQIKKYEGVWPNYERIDNDGVEQRAIFVHEEAHVLTIEDDAGTISMPANVKIGKFIDPSTAYSLAFSAYVQAKYFTILAEILTDPQKITALFKLSANDIRNLDLFTPIWVDKFGEYYYINKVSNYKPGELTTVELIRI